SGMASCVSLSTCTKPGASPLGETSHCPALFDELMKSIGESAMKRRQWSSSRALTLRRLLGCTSPSNVRSASTEVNGSLKLTRSGVCDDMAHHSSLQRQTRAEATHPITGKAWRWKGYQWMPLYTSCHTSTSRGAIAR